MILSSAGTFLPSKLMKNSYSSLLRREGRDSMWVKFIPFSYEKEKFWSHSFLGKGIWHKDWINTCVSQQSILYRPNNSKAATGLEDFHNRERNRKEEWEICRIHPCTEHHHKARHYWKHRERWKQDTSCKQALYCKWQLQYLKHIMRACLCWQRHFPRINTGRRHSTCGVPSSWETECCFDEHLDRRLDEQDLGTLWDKLLPNCIVTCKATCTVSRAVSSCWAKIQREAWICTKKGSPGLCK